MPALGRFGGCRPTVPSALCPGAGPPEQGQMASRDAETADVPSGLGKNKGEGKGRLPWGVQGPVPLQHQSCALQPLCGLQSPLTLSGHLGNLSSLS